MDEYREVRELDQKIKEILLKKSGKQAVATFEKFKRVLKDQAGSDYLTGLPLRGAFMEKGTRQLGRAKRNKVPIAYLQIDIDHFKSVNDETGYLGKIGHEAGDLLLKDVTKRVIEPTLRANDLIGRVGGEEFGVFLEEITIIEAISLAERLRKKMYDVTANRMSVGVVTYEKIPESLTLETAMRQADKALYQAKNEGRDRCVLYNNQENVLK